MSEEAGKIFVVVTSLGISKAGAWAAGLSGDVDLSTSAYVLPPSARTPTTLPIMTFFIRIPLRLG